METLTQLLQLSFAATSHSYPLQSSLLSAWGVRAATSISLLSQEGGYVHYSARPPGNVLPLPHPYSIVYLSTLSKKHIKLTHNVDVSVCPFICFFLETSYEPTPWSRVLN